MKTISVNVSEPVYQEFQAQAKRTDRTTAELIREAMELFRKERFRPTTTLASLRPLDLGRVRKSALKADDLLEEMLHDSRP